MTLTAIITPSKDALTATLDPDVIAKAKLNLYELAQADGFMGTFDDFLGSIVDTPSLISDDNPNDLKLGSDNKLVSQPNDTDFLAYYILAKG